jgi:hypothetical protein
MSVFLIGPLLVMFYSFLPLVFVGAIGDLTTGSVPQMGLAIASLLCIPWNYYLKTKDTIIKIIMIPAWVWSIMFSILIFLGLVS